MCINCDKIKSKEYSVARVRPRLYIENTLIDKDEFSCESVRVQSSS